MPESAAKRELLEEIGFKPPFVHKLGLEIIPDLGNLTLHAYCCPLLIQVEEIKLMEGLDLGLFSLEEMMAKVLYSYKMGGLFPILEKLHFINTIKKLLNYLETI
jgi:8-oxo-dGTP pyrophosphatase MutT (NUDIX family)